MNTPFNCILLTGNWAIQLSRLYCARLLLNIIDEITVPTNGINKIVNTIESELMRAVNAALMGHCRRLKMVKMIRRQPKPNRF